MERVIEDLKAGDRVCMDVGVCTVLAPATPSLYGMNVNIRTPNGLEYTLNYPAGSPFVMAASRG